VGCVVFRNNEIVAQGRTQAYRFEHAERMALKDFSGPAEECELFITLEPCTHQGHQPPCLDLVNQFKWKRVVIAAKDPNPLVAGQGLQALKAQQKEVVQGVLENEVIAWNFPFIFQHQFSRPMIVGKWAETASGLLADKDMQSKWISNERSREYTHWLRQKYDAILVGARTFIHDQPLLNCRLPEAHRQPLRLVWDPKQILRHNTKWLSCAEYLATGQKTLVISEGDLFNYLVSKTFQAHAAELLGRPLQSIMIEGGTRTLRHFSEHNALDLIHVFRALKDFNEESPHRSPVDMWSEPKGWTVLAKAVIQGDHLVEATRCPIHFSG
jgi:diaminohydroxyphosphoribosylaminopyrimidine deaminase/5-amino-6-(5-phosphoribosylamino)uracil reductase